MTPARIMIVEDDEYLGETLADILDTDGYEAVLFNNAQPALEDLRSGHRTGLILLDLAMPGMNGWRFCEALQAFRQGEAVPVVIMTSARRLPESLPEPRRGLLMKPFELGTLLAEVARAIAPVCENGTPGPIDKNLPAHLAMECRLPSPRRHGR